MRSCVERGWLRNRDGVARYFVTLVTHFYLTEGAIDLFAAFSAHHGFDFSSCNPYIGHEKGGVGRKGAYFVASFSNRDYYNLKRQIPCPFCFSDLLLLTFSSVSSDLSYPSYGALGSCGFCLRQPLHT